MNIINSYGKKPKILVLCGGPGTEHIISLQSGYQIYNNIDRNKFEPLIVIIDKDLKWYLLEESNLQDLMLWGRCDFVPLTFDGSKNDFESEEVDLVFETLHGSFGEGGPLQAILDQAKIPYVGSNMESSVITMNKVLTNKLVSDITHVPYFVEVKNYNDLKTLYPTIQTTFSQKVIIKPSVEGSSFGVKLVDNIESVILNTSADLFHFGSLIIQDFVNGIELTCPVLGEGANVRALEVIEIKHEREVFDTKAKYTDINTQEVPAEIEPFLIKSVQEKSIQIHNALGCKGITRSDFIYCFDPHTHNDVLYFLEINTRPGMSKASITPKSAKAIGWDFTELITRIIESSL